LNLLKSYKPNEDVDGNQANNLKCLRLNLMKENILASSQALNIERPKDLTISEFYKTFYNLRMNMSVCEYDCRLLSHCI
jgi:hypothetical protein